jgi:hypothetical protein
MWKELAVADFRVLLRHLVRGTEETTKASVRLVGIRAEILTGHVQNTGQKRYCLRHLARFGNELGVSCHIYWGDEKCVQNFSQKLEWKR